jgi:GAF domain-containing protein
VGIGQDVTERHRSESEQTALRRLATMVAEGRDPSEIFSAVSEEVGRLFGSDLTLVARFDPDGPVTVVMGVAKDVPGMAVGSRWQLEDGLAAARVYRTGRSARIDTVNWSDLNTPIGGVARREGVVSTVSCPIRVEGRLWGTITVPAKEPLPPDTEERLEKFTQVVAAAIANAESRDALARLADEQAALRRVATLVARGAKLDEVFLAVSGEVGRLLGTGLVAVGRLAPDGRALDFVAADGGHQRVELDELVASAEVFRTGRSARTGASDWESEPGETAERLRSLGVVSTVVSPIVVEGQVWGIIAAAGTEEVLPPDTEERLEKFTEIVATAIANAEYREARAVLTDEQAALRRVATLVAEGATTTRLAATVLDEVVAVFGVPAAWLIRYEPERTMSILAAINDPSFQVGSVWPLEGTSVSAAVFETGRAARIDDFAGLEGAIAARTRESGFLSSLGVPIVVDGAVWGAICVGTTDTEPLPRGIEDRLDRFTELVATAISNADAREHLRGLADEQAALRRVATLVARDAPSTEVFESVATEVGKLFDTDITIVGRYDNDGMATSIGNWSASPGGVPVGTRSAIGGRNVLSMVAETGKPARMDAYEEASGQAGEIARRHGWRSSIAAPIVVEGRLWGVMLVATQRPDPFPAGAEDRLAAFTDLVATAVANAQAHDEVLRFADEQAALGRVATLVAGGAAPERVFAAVVDEVSNLLELERIELVRYEGDASGTVIAASGDHPFPAGSTWSLDDPSVMATVASTRRSARIDDYTKLSGEIARAARSAGFQSAIGAPITVEGRLWGVIIAISTDPEPIPERSEARLDQFTELVATAVANAEARNELESVAAEQAALRRIATLVARGGEPEQVFAAVAEETAAMFGAITAVNRFEHDPPGIVFVGASRETGIPIGTRWPLAHGMASNEVYRTGRSARRGVVDWESYSGPLAEAAHRLSVHSQVSSPVIVEGSLWGVVTVNAQDELPSDTEQRLEKFAELVTTAIANAESKSALAASRRRIVAASDETRRRIERDLHDGTQQRLVALGLAVRAAEANLPPERDDLRAQLSGVATGLVAAVEDLQEISRGIHPSILSKGGLGPALQTLAHRSAIPVALDIATDVRLAGPIEVAAYFVASEALANAAKHSEASRIDVSLKQRDGSLVLSIADDGVGGADPSRGSGLIGLSDRVEALGGSISVRSRTAKGTRITAELPLELDLPQPAG